MFWETINNDQKVIITVKIITIYLVVAVLEVLII